MTELITKMTPTGIRDESKVIIKNIVKSLQIYGFWCVIIIMIGFYLGILYCNKTRKDDIKNSITLKAFIYESKVYEIKERLLQ
jgi:uncharacterized membrane protein